MKIVLTYELEVCDVYTDGRLFLGQLSSLYEDRQNHRLTDTIAVKIYGRVLNKNMLPLYIMLKFLRDLILI